MNILFLDANILLDFYRYGLDDLSEVRKLLTLMKDDEIVIYSNKLLRDEVNRGREAELSQSFETLSKFKFELKFPNYCSEMDEIKPLREALKKANECHKGLVTALKGKLSTKALAADKLIAELFEESTDLEITPELIDRAIKRQQFNNPPRKRKDSIGDSLHWEVLLGSKKIYRLHLISRDADFASEIETTKLKDFLREEWTDAHGKHSRIVLHKSLVEFFKSNYPEIKLSDEVEKNQLISQLAASPNFSTTHDLIEQLSKFDFYTNGQTVQMFVAFAENQQVNWIGADEDVQKFFLSLKDKAYLVPPDYYEIIADQLDVDEGEFFNPF